MENFKHVSVLYITPEGSNWFNSGRYPYPLNFGYEEGFHANCIKYYSIPGNYVYSSLVERHNSWISHFRTLLDGKSFDQAWIEISHSHYSAEFLEWLSQNVSTRVGILHDSFDIDPREYENNPEATSARLTNMQHNIEFMTHCLACDEKDVLRFNQEGKIKGLWYAGGSIPSRFIVRTPKLSNANKVIFYGNVYNAREAFINNQALRNQIELRSVSFDDCSVYSGLFDEIKLKEGAFLREKPTVDSSILESYLNIIRNLRIETFKLWLRSLQESMAVINLPQFAKAYSSRVVEGIAAGVPVISWRIPERPRTYDLFEEGSEILLFDQEHPEELAEHLRRIRSDHEYGSRIARNALKKLRQQNTTEHLIRRVLHWLETGEDSAGTETHTLYQYASSEVIHPKQIKKQIKQFAAITNTEKMTVRFVFFKVVRSARLMLYRLTYNFPFLQKLVRSFFIRIQSLLGVVMILR